MQMRGAANAILIKSQSCLPGPCVGMSTFRVYLDRRIFAGFLECAVPKERKYVGVFGKGKRRFLFRRKGNELRAFYRKKNIRLEPMEISLAFITAACALSAWDRENR